jgi:thiol-disulfide isomerase/thioredoxin
MTNSAFSQSNEFERKSLPPERRSVSILSILPWVALAVIIGLMYATRGWWQKASEPRGERHPAVGRQVSRFDLKPLTGDGPELEASHLLGKFTLVNLWGPWCGACAIEFPHLVEIERHFRDQPGFQFVSVSTNFDLLDETGLAESTAEFLKGHHAEFATYRDPRGATTRALVSELGLESFGYPTTLLIGPDRRVLAVWPGYIPGDEKSVERVVESALRKPAAAKKTDVAS